MISDNRREVTWWLPFLASSSLFGAVVLIAACTPTDGNGDNSKAAETGSGKKDPSRYGLVHAASAVPGVKIDLRYRYTSASGRPLYPMNMPCLLNKATAAKLAKAQRILKADGYGLKILDAWRPPEAHRALWKSVQDPRYVVPPSDGLSLHCYGTAVDVTLVDSTGREMKMPSRFDEFSARAASNYTGPDPEIRENLNRLRSAMKQAGFRGIPAEWWHYDVPGAPGIYRVSAEDLGIRLPL